VLAHVVKDLITDTQGGNIVQALNYPSDTFHASVDDLVKRLQTGAPTAAS